METEEEQCMRILTNAVNECKSDWIALSGGLDSSILAHLRKDQKPQTMTIITKDFLGTDLTFAQIIAKYLGLNLSLIQVSMEEVLDSINETIKILGNYNDIEIRNSIVPYIYLTTLKKKGYVLDGPWSPVFHWNTQCLKFWSKISDTNSKH